MTHVSPRQRSAATSAAYATAALRRWIVGLLLALGCVGAFAQPSDYPNKPIRLITSFAAGASTDKLARLVADSMAAGIVTMNQHIYKKLKFDAQKDLTPLTIAVRMPIVLVATPKQPFSNARALLDHAKANPGKLTYGSAGIGTSQHLAGELFKNMSGTHIVHIPYKGGAPAMTDLLGGQVDLMFVQGPSALPQVKAGKLRALAVGSPARSPLFPDVPTLAEVGLAGHDSDTWYGFVAPAGVPAPILNKLQSAVVAALKDNAKRLEEDGFALEASSAAAMAQAIRSESVKWGAVIKRAKIEAE